MYSLIVARQLRGGGGKGQATKKWQTFFCQNFCLIILDRLNNYGPATKEIILLRLPLGH